MIYRIQFTKDPDAFIREPVIHVSLERCVIVCGVSASAQNIGGSLGPANIGIFSALFGYDILPKNEVLIGNYQKEGGPDSGMIEELVFQAIGKLDPSEWYGNKIDKDIFILTQSREFFDDARLGNLSRCTSLKSSFDRVFVVLIDDDEARSLLDDLECLRERKVNDLISRKRHTEQFVEINRDV